MGTVTMSHSPGENCPRELSPPRGVTSRAANDNIRQFAAFCDYGQQTLKHYNDWLKRKSQIVLYQQKQLLTVRMGRRDLHLTEFSLVSRLKGIIKTHS